MKKTNILLLSAKYISLVFTPFFLPIMGLIALFMFTYLGMMPWMYKIALVVLVWIFTVLLPQHLIRLYRRYQGWSLLRLITRTGRNIPYIISIACYCLCYYLMNLNHVPHLMSSIIIAAIVIQVLCAYINNMWKISTHTAAIGGTTGAVAAFSLLFGFNALWWICFLILLAGIVGTSRTLLRIHTLGEVTGGFLVGLFAGFAAVVVA